MLVNAFNGVNAQSPLEGYHKKIEDFKAKIKAMEQRINTKISEIWGLMKKVETI